MTLGPPQRRSGGRGARPTPPVKGVGFTRRLWWSSVEGVARTRRIVSGASAPSTSPTAETRRRSGGRPRRGKHRRPSRESIGAAPGGVNERVDSIDQVERFLIRLPNQGLEARDGVLGGFGDVCGGLAFAPRVNDRGVDAARRSASADQARCACSSSFTSWAFTWVVATSRCVEAAPGLRPVMRRLWRQRCVGCGSRRGRIGGTSGLGRVSFLRDRRASRRWPRPREQVVAAVTFEPVELAVSRHAAEEHQPLTVTPRTDFRLVVSEIRFVHDRQTAEQLAYPAEVRVMTRFVRPSAIAVCRNGTPDVQNRAREVWLGPDPFAAKFTCRLKSAAWGRNYVRTPRPKCWRFSALLWTSRPTSSGRRFR
jgi:hypothetical protein